MSSAGIFCDWRSPHAGTFSIFCRFSRWVCGDVLAFSFGVFHVFCTLRVDLSNRLNRGETMQKQSEKPLVSFEADEWLTVRQISAIVPGRPHVASVIRWTQRPVRGRILPSSMFGGKRLIKYSDLLDFLNENEEQTLSDDQIKRQAIAAAQVDVLLN